MLRKAAWVGRGHILDEGEKGKAFILVWQRVGSVTLC